ncbi:Major Facilitator Superfamily (MFS) [Thraustotheca clavata]|uniref:Major Facilitator Superfamily (MFS) n=1 Tax=Thraustotheca clavata TaxID=74557 RepID=A0A1W0A239_9STRA|nr:Major Facilitator Superfamily (MFS) [Thraustotheca clavata]
MAVPSRLNAVLSLVAGALIMTSIGSCYAISAWNAELKAELGMDQSQIAFVSSSLSFGLYWAIIPGALYDRYGGKFSIIAGTILIPSLYAILSSLTKIQATPIWLAIVLGFVGLSGQFSGIVCLGSNEGLFGENNRGKVLGLLFSCFSGGGAVFSFIFKTFFSDNVAGYFTFLSIEALIVCGFGVFFLAQKTKDVHDYKSLPSSRDHIVIEDVGGWNLTKEIRFWYLFIAVMFGVGSGLLVMTNMAFIYESAGGMIKDVSWFVSTFSMCNLFGRLAVGYLSDHYLPILPRAAFLGIGIALTMVSEVLFLTMPMEYFVIPVALGGIAEGFLLPTYTVLTRELFGSLYFGKNFGAMTLANAVGYPLILGPLSSMLYKNHTHVNPDTGVERCIGSSCFFDIFLISIGLNAVGLYCSWKLSHAT